jgi:hypothetical protein
MSAVAQAAHRDKVIEALVAIRAEAKSRNVPSSAPGAPVAVAPATINIDLAAMLAQANLAAMLAHATPEQQKQMIGERLYPLIVPTQQQLAGKITGMLLDGLDTAELLGLIDSPVALDEKIKMALDALGIPHGQQLHQSPAATAGEEATPHHRDKIIDGLVAMNSEAESGATGSGGCIAGRDTYGLVVHVGDIRDGIQRNVLVANVQTGAYSLYPASALLPCSSSLIISSESERDSLVSELIRLYPTIGEFGVNSGTIKGLIQQYGSKFW